MTILLPELVEIPELAVRPLVNREVGIELHSELQELRTAIKAVTEAVNQNSALIRETVAVVNLNHP